MGSVDWYKDVPDKIFSIMVPPVGRILIIRKIIVKFKKTKSIILGMIPTL